MPYDLSPEFIQELFTKHRVDYIIHGDDPCLLPDGTDAYAHAKKLGRFRMVSGVGELHCDLEDRGIGGTMMVPRGVDDSVGSEKPPANHLLLHVDQAH